MPDLINDLEQAEFNITQIQQETMAVVESIRRTAGIKIENEKLFDQVAEELARKRTEQGQKAIKDENLLRLRMMQAYNKKLDEDRQKAFEQEKKVIDLSTRHERKEWESNAKYRSAKEFEAFKNEKLQELALTKEGTKRHEKLKQELLDRVHQRELEIHDENRKALNDEFNERARKIDTEKQLMEELNKAPHKVDIVGRVNADANEKDKKANLAEEKVAASLEALQEAERNGASPEEIERLRQEHAEDLADAQAKREEADAAKQTAAIVNAISDGYKAQYEKATSILSDYMGSVNARLQGSGEGFYRLSDKISSMLSLSPFVKTTKVMDEMKKAVDAGIAYNIEQRAFLSSISDRIATTFDVFDSNLMRVIRLQQADTTTTRMGMEAYLTKLLNNMFQDTSYLNGVYDSVAGALIDATASLNHKASAEFEYVVQKWLGALSSLGMSEGAITNIAQGINYLATGDVQNLANNSSLQTLFAMAATNTGKEYSEMLLDGLDAGTTNDLLRSVVQYLKSIAEGSENQVVRRAYGDIFNLSHSDLKAISNLTDAEISTLANNMLSYTGMKNEINTQMAMVATRTSLASMLDTVYENVLYGVASDMANNPITFAMQKMLDFLDQTKTDIHIPFINAAGFGFDPNASVRELMQMGLGIGQGLSLASNIAVALSSGSMGGLNLDAWGAEETTRRGSGGFNLSLGGTLGGLSSSLGSFSGSGNAEDMKNDTISGAEDEAKSSENYQEPPEHNIDDLYNDLFGTSRRSVLTKLDLDTTTGLPVRVINQIETVAVSTLPLVEINSEQLKRIESTIISSKSTNTFNLAAGTKLSIDSAELAKAIAEQIFLHKASGDDGTLGAILSNLNTIAIGDRAVQVKNDPASPFKAEVSGSVTIPDFR